MSSEDARQSAGPRAEGRLPHAGEWRHLLSLVYLRRDSTAPVQPMWRRDLLSADECRKEEGGGRGGGRFCRRARDLRQEWNSEGDRPRYQARLRGE
jgi:hypothetical protein